MWGPEDNVFCAEEARLLLIELDVAVVGVLSTFEISFTCY